MDGTFVEAIRDLVQPQVLDLNGVEYDPRKGVVVYPPVTTALKTTTLASLRDFMAGNPDGLDPKKIVAHIVGPDTVDLCSALEDKYRRREVFVRAEAKAGRFQFGQFIENEEFIIQVLCLFAEGGDRSRLLQVVGNIADESVRTASDDGVTQTVTTKVGITQRAEMTVPNPVVLIPFRTFPEVAQPSSKFVFRMASGARRGEEAGTCALFEADNGAWRAEALWNIKAWLTANLPAGVTILS